MKLGQNFIMAGGRRLRYRLRRQARFAKRRWLGVGGLYHLKSNVGLVLFFPIFLDRARRGRISRKAFYFDVLAGTKKCGPIVGLKSHKGQKMGKKYRRKSKQNYILNA